MPYGACTFSEHVFHTATSRGNNFYSRLGIDRKPNAEEIKIARHFGFLLMHCAMAFGLPEPLAENILINQGAWGFLWPLRELLLMD